MHQNAAWLHLAIEDPTEPCHVQNTAGWAQAYILCIVFASLLLPSGVWQILPFWHQKAGFRNAAPSKFAIVV